MPPTLPRTIAEAARLIEARKLSPVELVSALVQRIESVDPILSSFITVTADQALAQARLAEKEIAGGRYRGVLHGIPFGAKDNYDTAGIRTTGHSKVYENRVPLENAAVIDRLYDAGAILMGKLALHELAHGGPSFDLPWPPARNPWNPGHFTGGSSSGSGAAAAAGLALFTLGSDTGGSIRTPAALCGLVGLKPTFGLVSRYGVIPDCYSLDHCGPMARTVEDCAILMQTMSAHDPRERSSAPGARPDYRGALRRDLKGLRVGVVRHFWEEDLPAEDDLARATDEALRVMQALGARAETVRLRPVGDYYDVWTLIESPETFAIQRASLLERPGDFGFVFLERTLLACLIQAADYTDAQRVRTRLADEMQQVWQKFDVLLTAGAGPAPRLDPRLATWPSMNRFSPFAMTGVPAIVVPAGYSREGLPLGIQLVAKPFDDAFLLGVAHAYEQATNWWSQREPALAARASHTTARYEPPRLATAGMDAALLGLCEQAARSAGLRLNDSQLALLCTTAPPLFEMLRRVRLAAGTAEPASIFSFPSTA